MLPEDKAETPSLAKINPPCQHSKLSARLKARGCSSVYWLSIAKPVMWLLRRKIPCQQLIPRILAALRVFFGTSGAGHAALRARPLLLVVLNNCYQFRLLYSTSQGVPSRYYCHVRRLGPMLLCRYCSHGVHGSGSICIEARRERGSMLYAWLWSFIKASCCPLSSGWEGALWSHW